MERIAFKNKTLNGQPRRVDRFVRSRETVNDLRRRRSSQPDCQPDDDNPWITKYWHQKNYGDNLDKLFGVEKHSDKYVVQPWPCVPRKRSYLTSADSILDLPAYSYANYPELLDWSSDDILVAALGRDYHQWSWGSQTLAGQGIAMHEIQSCKFDPTGQLLLLGTNMKAVEVHDSANNKCVSMSKCYCYLRTEVCSITAVEWSPTGNSYVTGCTTGVVTSFTRTSRPISWARHFREPIVSVRISPDTRFAAATILNSTQLLLLSWPYLKLISNVNFENSFNLVIAWHPWRSALLGIGAAAVTSKARPRVVMCEAPTGKVKDWPLGGSKYCVDTMLFSNRTGELVMSLYHTERGLLYQKTSSQLVVLSNPDTVVDQWSDDGRTGIDRVRTMVFSPDGTKLATATSDEDLIIWNFLPEDKNRKKAKLKRFSAIPVFLDESTQGYALR